MRDVVSVNGAILIGDVSMKEKLEEKNDFAGIANNILESTKNHR